MPSGGKRHGAGRKPNPHKGKQPSAAIFEPLPPRTYDTTVAQQAKRLCELGATDLELADFFGISVDTIYRWKVVYPEFCEAVRVGKEPADDRVERSLYHRAVGYTFVSEKIAINGKGKVTRVPIREHVPPEPGAAFNWLKNRRKDAWRDKQVLEHGGPDGGPLTLEAIVLASMKSD